MNIYKMKKDELELLSFTDIAYQILKNEEKPKSTVEIFKVISKLLDLSDDDFAGKIGDFYTTLTTDKRFYALTDGNWDLKERHSTKIVIDDEDDVELEMDDINNPDDVETNEHDFDETEDYEDNDLDDLVIIENDETEEE